MLESVSLLIEEVELMHNLKTGLYIVVFGGLTGTDDSPKRLNDLWIGAVSVK